MNHSAVQNALLSEFKIVLSHPLAVITAVFLNFGEFTNSSACKIKYGDYPTFSAFQTEHFFTAEVNKLTIKF